MIELIPFHPNHVNKLNLRKNFDAKASILATGSGIQLIQKIAKLGNALTMVDGETVLAVITWFVPRAGIIDIGMFVSEDIYTRKKSYLRFSYKNFKMFLSTLNDGSVRRIQTMSYADPQHDEWMRWLGFEYEGRLKKLAPDGSDMTIWAITEVNHG